MEKNKDYWNKGLPYLDGIEFYNLLPFSPELGSGILSGRVDYARVTDPVTFKKAQATKGMSVSSFNQSVIQATYTNTKKAAAGRPAGAARHAPRVRPADPDRGVKDVTPMQIGGFIYPFSDFATPKAELVKRIGYQDDPAAAEKEAKALMAAAGHAERHPGPRFPGPRRRQLSSLVAGDPGDAAGDAEHQLQSAQCRGIGVVRRHRQRPFRPGDRRGRVDAA